MDDSYGTLRLDKSKDAQQLVNHARSVVTFHNDFLNRRKRSLDFLAGNHHTPEDLEIYKRKRKTPVTYNLMIGAERAVSGLMLNNKYDVSFMPFEPTDQDTTDARQALYQHTEYSQDWKLKDASIFSQGWAAGAAYQEFWVDVAPGREGILKTTNLNNFCVFWDPESREVITRYDAQYVDRHSLQEWSALVAKNPEKIKEEDFDKIVKTADTVEQTGRAYRDSGFLDVDQRNRRVKIIERFYKVYKTNYYVLDKGFNRFSIPSAMVKSMKESGQEVYSEQEEQLYLAVVCPSWTSAGAQETPNTYLFNGPYHCQPRDPQSRHIIWPILEFVSAHIQGDPIGFVESMIGPNQIVNSVMSNIFQATRHQANTSLIRKKGMFTGKNAKDFDKNHTDSDRIFEAEDKADLEKDLRAVPSGTVSQDSYKALEISKSFSEEVSSVPPPLKGFAEAAGVSGKLNGQRIEQAVMQLQSLMMYWRLFMKQRAKLAQYYWKTYYTIEKDIRIINPDALAAGANFWKAGNQNDMLAQAQQFSQRSVSKAPQFMTINKMEPETDPFGNQTGGIRKMNDMSGAEFDVIIEDSYQSPTLAEKTKADLVGLMGLPGIQADPQLFGILSLEYARYSNMSEETKNLLRTWSSLVQQRTQAEQAQQQQNAQLDTMQKVQQVAQNEPTPISGAQSAKSPFGAPGGQAPNPRVPALQTA